MGNYLLITGCGFWHLWGGSRQIVGRLLYNSNSGIALVYGWAGKWQELGRQDCFTSTEKKKWKKPKLIYWLSSQPSAFSLPAICPSSLPQGWEEAPERLMNGWSPSEHTLVAKIKETEVCHRCCCWEKVQEREASLDPWGQRKIKNKALGEVKKWYQAMKQKAG